MIALNFPLAGRTTSRGPLGVQALMGLAMLLVNDASGSTRSWVFYDDEDTAVAVIDRDWDVQALIDLRRMCTSVDFLTYDAIASSEAA